MPTVILPLQVEDLILSVCRKHPEVSREVLVLASALLGPFATCKPPFRSIAVTCIDLLGALLLLLLLQGIQDTLLEKELPDVPVNDRAMAINALLSSLKLQVGVQGLPLHA